MFFMILAVIAFVLLVAGLALISLAFNNPMKWPLQAIQGTSWLGVYCLIGAFVIGMPVIIVTILKNLFS